MPKTLNKKWDSMDAETILMRVKCILLSPASEWERISAEQTANKNLILYYVFPFAAAAALVGLIFTWINTGIGFAIRVAVLELVSPMITIIISALVINEMSVNFKSTKNLNRAYKLVVYSYTPILLLNIIVSISPVLFPLRILGLYGVYLLWTGLPLMMRTSGDQRLVFSIACAVSIFVALLIIRVIFRAF